MTEAEVVKMLLEHGQQRYESHRYRLPKHVADLVYTNAFAFLVAVAFDRGMSWKKAWEISYWISEEGKLDTDLLAQMSYTALASLLESLPFLPRYGSTEGARTLRDCAKLALEFGGDAASIWRDASPKQVENRLRRIHGVGQGIASMAVRVLRDDHLMFRGQEHEINVKLGVHVMRVFKRTRLTDSENKEEVFNAARRLHPTFPGALDWPAWNIGQHWCTPQSPDCEDCPLTVVCPKWI